MKSAKTNGVNLMELAIDSDEITTLEGIAEADDYLGGWRQNSGGMIR